MGVRSGTQDRTRQAGAGSGESSCAGCEGPVHFGPLLSAGCESLTDSEFRRSPEMSVMKTYLSCSTITLGVIGFWVVVFLFVRQLWV